MVVVVLVLVVLVLFCFVENGGCGGGNDGAAGLVFRRTSPSARGS